MIGYISIGSYRIKGDDWQSHPLREVVSTVPPEISLDNSCLSHYGCGWNAPSDHYSVVFNVIES